MCSKHIGFLVVSAAQKHEGNIHKVSEIEWFHYEISVWDFLFLIGLKILLILGIEQLLQISDAHWIYVQFSTAHLFFCTCKKQKNFGESLGVWAGIC